MYWSILHRMIFWELVRVFFMALLALTGMLVMGGVVAEATQHGLGPIELLEAIPLLIPSTLPYTLPATTLFATCVVYGRLAHDNEVLAVKSAGIHLGHVVWPAVLLGILTSGITVVLSLDVIPSTHHELRTRFVRDVEKFLYNILKREGSIRHSKLPYSIYVQRVQGRKLLEALFMRRDPKDQHYDIIAWAREATLEVDVEKKQINVRMRHCSVASENDDNAVLEDEHIWPVDLPPDISDAHKKSSARSMTWQEIVGELDKKEQDKDYRLQKIAEHQAELNLNPGAPKEYEQHIKDLRNEVKKIDKERRLLITELHMRPALALGCLCFVLVGCPVGIWFSRSDYLSAFITCFLPIVVVYYPLMLCGINLSKLEQLSPWLAVWTADVLIAIIALTLFRKLLRN